MDIQAKINATIANQVSGKVDDIKSKTTEAEQRKLKKACADFESLFVYNLLKTMRQSIPKSGLTGTGAGNNIYEMMLDQKIAQAVTSKPGGIGLQQMLQTQISRSEKAPESVSETEKNN